ncbi:hypothetical protein HED48_21120 [Ochrobactrum intermedium]|nr:hypothetical protein [Brucella intermedia]
MINGGILADGGRRTEVQLYRDRAVAGSACRLILKGKRLWLANIRVLSK